VKCCPGSCFTKAFRRKNVPDMYEMYQGKELLKLGETGPRGVLMIESRPTEMRKSLDRRVDESIMKTY
jgi:hypothetical protein